MNALAPLRRARRRAPSFGAAAGLALILASVPAGSAALDVRVQSRHPHTDLHVGAVGDTLRSEFVVVVEDGGTGVAGVEVRLEPAERTAAKAIQVLEPSAVTNPLGHATFDVVLTGPPGRYTMRTWLPSRPTESEQVPMRVLRDDWFLFLLMGVGGGLALFLYGMRLVGRGLEKAAGGKLRDYLTSMTSNRALSFLFGMVSTLLVQSSSASTVLLVSFAAAGLVTVGQCLGALLGAAVGSTITVQLIAFRLSDYALLLLAIGFFLTMARRRVRRVGGVVFGFGLLFFGLQIMTDSLEPLHGFPAVIEFLVSSAERPIPALLIATLLTGIAQASAATIGIVLGLSFQGILTLPAALPFILGANVGTSMTAIIASFTTNVAGKRVAWAHLGFRLGGVLLVLPFLGPFAELVQRMGGDVARQVANAHTLVNLGTALVFLPFIPLALHVLRRLIPERPESDVYGPKSLDPRFHEQPSIAIASAVREILRMGELVTSMLDDVRRSLTEGDEDLASSIRDRDDKVDILDDAITRYLADLSTEVLSASQSERVLDLLFVSKDLELIADIVSKGLAPGLLERTHEHSLRFSDEGYRQILEFHDGVREAVELAVAAVATWDRDLAGQVLQKKRALSLLERRFQLDHLRRLREKNTDTRATSEIHRDAINDLKQIVTHTARIAYAVLGKIHEFPKDDEIGRNDTTAAEVGSSDAYVR